MSASDLVRALVSGLPSGARERRRFMVMQCYIDDSATSGQVFTLAGYIAPSEKWAVFSNEWQQLLTLRPAWRRFKMSSIMADNPGEETMKRVQHHYRTIEKYADAGICFVIPIKPLAKAVTDYCMPDFIRNPYFVSWKNIIILCLQYMKDFGINEQIDFVFDERTEANVVLAGWDSLRGTLTNEDRKIIKNRPIFRSDDEFLPLQAADLMAWCVRKQYQELGTIMSDRPLFPWRQRRVPFPLLRCELDERMIRKQMRRDKAAMLMGLGPSWSTSASFLDIHS